MIEDAQRNWGKLVFLIVSLVLFTTTLLVEGLVPLAGSRMYTSMADTDEVIDNALKRFEKVLAQADK
ncbi:MAG: hypothetical protein H8E14_04695 [Candidatus Marinimicrobia bacterium]|nr:hypothetical protein [Candidatus Neomarinimicrobiota bacterium]